MHGSRIQSNAKQVFLGYKIISGKKDDIFRYYRKQIPILLRLSGFFV